MFSYLESHCKLDLFRNRKRPIQVDALENDSAINHCLLIVPVAVEPPQVCATELVANLEPGAPATADIQTEAGWKNCQRNFR